MMFLSNKPTHYFEICISSFREKGCMLLFKKDVMFTLFIEIWLLLFVTLTSSAGNWSVNIAESVLAMSHPRLILSESQMNNLEVLLKSDSSMMDLNSYIIKESENIKNLPTLEYKKKGRRLLEVSNEALKRIFYLSYAYRLSNDKSFADKAIQEMLNICSFQDWNESHFLDTAEMTMAVAIGYDWLYDILTSDEKMKISNAIFDKAFAYVLDGRGPFYLRASNNWNSVCNSGMLHGAIAIMEANPEIATKIVESCMDSNPRALKSYQPDGGFPEGYAYWGYGTTFQVMLMDLLESVLGYESEDAQAFLNTGKFVQYMEAPSGNSFNFSDCGPSVSGKIPMWWFAWKTGDHSLIYSSSKYLDGINYKFSEKRLLPLVLVYASRLNDIKSSLPTPKAVLFQGKTPVYIYRGGWDKNDDTYLAVKGGSASTSHAHADAGSFVYEFGGERWAMDFGSQDYYPLEKDGVDLWNMNQDSQRWDIMRMRNDCHNTLTIDSLRHNVKAKADILETFDTDSRKGVVVDMTTTLGNVKRAHRAVFLDEYDCLHIIDSISTGGEPIELMWVMVTEADAEIISQNEIRLSKNGKTLSMTILSDSDQEIRPQIWQNTPQHEYDAPNPNTRRVGFIAAIGNDKDISIESTLIMKNV